MSYDDQGYRFLAIPNWKKYQATDRKKGDIRAWVKDHSNKDGDYEYSKLTALQRYVWDAMIRLRARFGHHAHNDPTWIARATHMLPRDRAHVPDAIRTLITHGLLILTNEQVKPPESESEADTESDSESKSEYTAAVAAAYQPPVEEQPRNSFVDEQKQVKTKPGLTCAVCLSAPASIDRKQPGYGFCQACFEKRQQGAAV